MDADEYEISGGEMLYGFVAGLVASNYDITELFIDGILKMLTTICNRLGVCWTRWQAIAEVVVTVSRFTVKASALKKHCPLALQACKKYLWYLAKAVAFANRQEKSGKIKFFYGFLPVLVLTNGLLWRYTNKATFYEVYYAL